jgi:lysozyme
MTFNMGIGRVLGFAAFLGALERGDYEMAAREMLASRWATQVGNRAVELAEIMRTGVDPFTNGKSGSGGAIG